MELFEKLYKIKMQLAVDVLKKSREAGEVMDNVPFIKSCLDVIGERMLSMNEAVEDLREKAESLEERMNKMDKVKAIMRKSVTEMDLIPLEEINECEE